MIYFVQSEHATKIPMNAVTQTGLTEPVFDTSSSIVPAYRGCKTRAEHSSSALESHVWRRADVGRVPGGAGRRRRRGASSAPKARREGP